MKQIKYLSLFVLFIVFSACAELSAQVSSAFLYFKSAVSGKQKLLIIKFGFKVLKKYTIWTYL